MSSQQRRTNPTRIVRPACLHTHTHTRGKEKQKKEQPDSEPINVPLITPASLEDWRNRRVQGKSSTSLGDVFCKVLLVRHIAAGRRLRPRSSVRIDRRPAAATDLIADAALGALRRILLVAVEARFDDPLVAEGVEAARLVVELVDELVGPVRFELHVCDTTRDGESSQAEASSVTVELSLPLHYCD